LKGKAEIARGKAESVGVTTANPKTKLKHNPKPEEGVLEDIVDQL